MLPLFAALAIATPALAGVSVSAPINNSSVSASVQYVATATTTCSKGVSAMGIYTAPNVLAYTVNGSSLNTELTLNPGTYHTVVQEWDNCGGNSAAPITILVSGGASQVQIIAPAKMQMLRRKCNTLPLRAAVVPTESRPWGFIRPLGFWPIESAAPV